MIEPGRPTKAGLADDDLFPAGALAVGDLTRSGRALCKGGRVEA